jgi:uncharacterized protein (DUF1501 family)
MRKSFSRRRFLVGCSGAITALAGSRITTVAFADPLAPGAFNDDILLVVFLRGGWDALNVVMPIAGADRGFYENARPYLKVPASGAGAALGLDGQFGLHPAMAPLHALYQSKKLAVIQAAGLTSDTRSHFDAMAYMELGTPGNKTIGTGWLTRHLQSATNLPPSIIFPVLSAGGSQPLSLLGTLDAVAMSSPSDFKLWTHWQYGEMQRAALRDLYAGVDWLETAGTQTLDTIDLIESLNPGEYHPANGATYPNDEFGRNLQAVAQLIKMPLGLRVATVDLGGWDTHSFQGDGSSGYFADGLLGPLAQGLAALYTDLDGAGAANFTRRTTVVVMSEFGRRLRENADHGTDHGHGNVMLALGGNVKGGKVYGQWPGLRNDQLYDGADLAITTDYRRVLSEIIIRRLGNPNTSTIFPGYTGYAPLDFITGLDTPGQEKYVYLPLVRR